MSLDVAVVTDSSAGVDAALFAGIHVVPIAVVVDGVSFLETELTADVFYDRVGAGAVASTATPGPGVFAEVYGRRAAEGAREVVSLHVDARLSGVVDAARLGAEDADVPVHVVDSGQVSFGLGLCALAVRRGLDGGVGVSDALDRALSVGGRLHNASFVAAPGSGRVAASNAIVSVVDGETVVLEGAAKADRAAERLAGRVAGDDALVVAVGHAGPAVAGHADTLASMLDGRSDVREVLRYRVAPSVGAHTGHETFGCFWWPAGAVESPV